MSELSSAPARFLENWRWLRPELALGRAGLGARLWPDLGPAGRERRRELAHSALAGLTALDQVPDASLTAGRRQLARRLLERELARQALPPDRLDLAALAASALGPTAWAADAGLALERLERLPELLEPLGAELPGGDATAGALAARRLRALAQHLEARLARLSPGRVSFRETVPLAELADHLERQPAASAACRAPHPDLDGGPGWELAPLLARIEEELTKAEAELERRAEALCLRLEGAAGSGHALPRALAHLARDLPRPEHWAWLHEDLQADLARFLRRLGLEAVAPPLERAPGVAPSWQDVELHESGRLLLVDLSLLPGPDLQAHLADRCHALLPLLAAREGLPGRAWLLARLRSRAENSLEEAVVACLIEPEDLEAWARWAGDWVPRQGWLAGDPRLRLMQKRQELRDLLLARADLELRLGIRPEAEVRRRLAQAGGLPAHLAETAWLTLTRRPGQAAAAAARLLEFREAGRRWRRNTRAAGSADWLLILADCAALPGAWLRRHLSQQPARGETLRPLPPALVKPAPKADALLGEVEERLAALGRIRREDLEAGREFDAAAPAGPIPQEAVEREALDESAE